MANKYQQVTSSPAALTLEGTALTSGSTYLIHNASNSVIYLFEGAETDIDPRREIPVETGERFLLKAGTETIYIRSQSPDGGTVAIAEAD